MSAVTHVVMTRVRVTPKLLYALVTATPIVTPQWLALAAARTRTDERSDVRCVPPLGPGPPEAVQQVRTPLQRQVTSLANPICNTHL